MRQEHKAGEKLFVDYSGKRSHYIDSETGERVDVELFTAVLGGSNYVYTEATRSQQLPDWIASHVRAFAFLGGVPRAVVPDQLKSAVTNACRYEPEINRTYAEMAVHYDVAIMPARPGKPKDKAKVEGAVLIVQRWELARLRNQRFFSLIELNGRIAELNDDLNGRVMRKYGYSRRQLFEQVERAALRPLHVEPFEFAEFKRAKVGIVYHIELDRHYYSVPYRLVGELVELRHTNTTVEVLHKNQRVASHVRTFRPGQYTTDPAHMPESHRKHAEWSPSRILDWAAKIGPETAQLANAILTERRHPEQGYRSCLGILRLGKKYSPDRLECACARAHAAGARSYRSVSSILEKGLDQLPRSPTPPAPSSGFETTKMSAANPTTSERHHAERTYDRTPPHAQARHLRRRLAQAAGRRRRHRPSFDERLGLLVDAEWLNRENKRLKRTLAEAKLRISSACIEDIDYPPRRELESRRGPTALLVPREGLRSTILASQVPVSRWHDHIGDPTVADALCDRILHRAHRIELKGPSRRKRAEVVEVAAD